MAGSKCSLAVEFQYQRGRGFDSRRVLGFISPLFLSNVSFKQVPQGGAALLLFLLKNECLAVRLGAKQA